MISTSGATYRQIDHWTNKGWLLTYERPEGAGSGFPKEWPDAQAEKARRMVALIKVGFAPWSAEQIADHADGTRVSLTDFAVLEIGAVDTE
jgi:hypothetical protein